MLTAAIYSATGQNIITLFIIGASLTVERQLVVGQVGTYAATMKLWHGLLCSTTAGQTVAC